MWTTGCAQPDSAAPYGLKGHHGSPATEAVLAALAPRICECRAELDAQHVGNALYGLKGQAGSSAVEAVLTVLAPKISQCREPLDAQAVSNALYGLKGKAGEMSLFRGGETPECFRSVPASLSLRSPPDAYPGQGGP